MVRLDELRPNELQNEPIKELDRELNEASLFLLRNLARETILETTRLAEAPVVQEEGEAVVLGIPGDYVRFMRLKMDGWFRSVETLSPLMSTAYYRQNNEYTRATPYSPVAFMVPWSHEEGGKTYTRALECYPKTESVAVDKFYYIPEIDAEDLPDVLHDPLVWLTVSRVFQAMREVELSQIAMQQMSTSVRTIQHGLLGEFVRPAGEGQGGS